MNIKDLITLTVFQVLGCKQNMNMFLMRNEGKNAVLMEEINVCSKFYDTPSKSHLNVTQKHKCEPASRVIRIPPLRATTFYN